MTEETIAIKKSTYTKLLAVLVVLAVALSFSAGFIIGGSGKTTGSAVAQNTEQQTQQQTQQQVASRVQLAVGDAPVKGSTSAPLTIIEFSDFSCPYCGAAAGGNQQVIDYFKSRSPSWLPAVPGIMQDYVDTGKVRFAFKYFPGHGTGPDAMKIALCANEQGKFWEVHDLFFANQNSIENISVLKNLSVQAGVNLANLDTCLTSGKYDNRLVSDTAEGQNAGVSGTPTFFIGNEQKGYTEVIGAQPYSTLKAVIDQELAG